MAEADWDHVTVLRKKPAGSGQLRTGRDVAAAQRQGLAVETQKKFAGGGNAQHSSAKNTAKLDRETEELHHDTVSMSVGKLIQQARQAKGWTQKELAQKINEKPQIVNEYEAAKAVPNNQVFGKLERALDMKLRGGNKGQPLAKGKK